MDTQEKTKTGTTTIEHTDARMDTVRCQLTIDDGLQVYDIHRHRLYMAEDGEEVARNKTMVQKKRPPSCRRGFLAPRHVLRHGGLGD